MSEKEKHPHEEATQQPSAENPDLGAMTGELRDLLTNVKEFQEDLSRGGQPIGLLCTAQIVLRTKGVVYIISERNTTGHWRSVINPGGAVGSMPGTAGLPGYPLTDIASDWHTNSEEAFAQALRRYCDLCVGPQVKQ